MKERFITMTSEGIWRRVTSLLLVLSLLVPMAPAGSFAAPGDVAEIAGQTPASWPAVFSPYTYSDGSIVLDPGSDEHPIDVDFTSGTDKGIGKLPSVYFASDGDNLFVRMRLKGDPYDRKGGFLSSVWLVQIAAGGQHAATIGLNGKSPFTDYVYVSSSDGSVVNSIYKTPAPGGSSVPGTRITAAENGHYFLDFQVPISRITAVAPGITGTEDVQLFYGSSKAANLSVINKEWMNGDGDSVEFSGLATTKLSAQPPTISIDNGSSFTYGSATTTTMSGASSVLSGKATLAIGNEDPVSVDIIEGKWSYALPGSITGANGTYPAEISVRENSMAGTDNQNVIIDQNTSATDHLSINGGALATTGSNRPTLSGAFISEKSGSAFDIIVSVNGNSYTAVKNQTNPITWSVSGVDLGSPVDGDEFDVAVEASKTTGQTKVIYAIATQKLKYIHNTYTNPINVSMSDLSMGETSPAIKGTCESATNVEVYIDDVLVEVDNTIINGGWGLEALERPLSSGNHTIKAVARNELGDSKETTKIHNVSQTAITIDNGLEATINDSKPTLRGSTNATDDKSIRVKVGSKEYTVYPKSGRWSVDVPDEDSLSDATHDVEASVVDTAAKATQKLKVDTGTQVAISAPGENELLKSDDRKPAISGTAEAGATVDVWLTDGYDKIFPFSVTAPESGMWSFTPSSDLSYGTCVINASASDPWGNEAYDSSSFTIGSNTGYTLAFNTNGGSMVKSLIGVSAGNEIAAPTPDPVKKGYSFGGWYSDEDLKSSYVFSTMPAGDVKLHAKWNAALKYNVKYDSNGATSGEAPVDTDSYAQGEAVTCKANSGEPALARTGYTFAGWNTSPDGKGTNYAAGTGTFDVGSSDMTLYAKWTPASYTVAFDENGGTAVDDQSISHGSKAAGPSPSPTRTGYSFGGWMLGSDAYDFNTLVTGALTLVAKWNEVLSGGGGGAQAPAPTPPPVPENTVEYKSDEPDIFLKGTNGEARPFMDYSKLSVGLPEGVGGDGPAPEVKIDDNGNVEAKNLQKGTQYDFEIKFELKPGIEIVVGHLHVAVDNNGSASVEKELIDPYGIVKDSVDGEIISGALVELYYADTQRNRANGIVPGTKVVLPILEGFAPNDNASPQYSNSKGQYAYMVFPDTDYYLVTTASGYNKAVSPTISVEKEIVKYDIRLDPVDVRDVGITLDSSLNKVQEGKQLKLSLDFYNKSSSDMGETSFSLVIPSGFTVKGSDGGKIVGKTITWNLGSAADKSKITKTVTLKAPELKTGEKLFTFNSYVKANKKVYYKEDDSSKLKALVFSTRYSVTHKRYIKGYPDKTFRPGKSITRAEVAAVFARIMELKSTVKGDMKFSDVGGKHWASKYIEAPVRKGLMSGYGDGSFRPDQPITRAELAGVMARYLGIDRSSVTPLIASNFSDIGNIAERNSIEELYRFDIVNGLRDAQGRFNPGKRIIRSEFVVLMDRMLYRGELTGMENTFSDMTKKNRAFGDAEEAIRTHVSRWQENGTEKMVRYISEKLW